VIRRKEGRRKRRERPKREAEERWCRVTTQPPKSEL
jgi:hypothetical protein